MGVYGSPEFLDYIKDGQAGKGTESKGKKRKTKEIVCPHCGKTIYIKRDLTPGLLLKWVLVVSISAVLLCFVLLFVVSVITTVA